jgi:hypothetical protein
MYLKNRGLSKYDQSVASLITNTLFSQAVPHPLTQYPHSHFNRLIIFIDVNRITIAQYLCQNNCQIKKPLSLVALWHQIKLYIKSEAYFIAFSMAPGKDTLYCTRCLRFYHVAKDCFLKVDINGKELEERVEEDWSSCDSDTDHLSNSSDASSSINYRYSPSESEHENDN